MRLFFEYMKRHDLLKPLLVFPCSIAIAKEKVLDGVVIHYRKIIVFHPVDHSDKLLVKIWHIDTRELETPLPDFDTLYLTREEIFDGKCIPEGFHIVLMGTDFKIPAYQSAPSALTYEIQWNAIFLGTTTTDMIYFLWDEFCLAFSHKIRLDKNRFIGTEMRYVEIEYPRIWQYFNIWKMHMLNLKNPIAPTLVISSSSASSDPKEVVAAGVHY